MQRYSRLPLSIHLLVSIQRYSTTAGDYSVSPTADVRATRFTLPEGVLPEDKEYTPSDAEIECTP